MKKINKHKSTQVYVLVVGISLLIGMACTKDKTPIPLKSDCPVTISFSNDILPVINDRCVSCHAQGSGSGEYYNHATISSNADAVLNSLQPSATNQMPMGSAPLHDSIIQKISCWIQQGKQNN